MKSNRILALAAALGTVMAVATLTSVPGTAADHPAGAAVVRSQEIAAQPVQVSPTPTVSPTPGRTPKPGKPPRSDSPSPSPTPGGSVRP